MERVKKNSRLRPAFFASFCGQLAALLKAGISPAEALDLMAEDAQPPEKAFLSPLMEGLSESGSLFAAMEPRPEIPAYLKNSIRLGEETGTLDQVTAALGVHYQREDEIRSALRSALTYPAILIGMMLVVIVVLIVEVLPIFNQVFLQLGAEMNGFGLALLDMGQGLRSYSLSCILLLIAAGLIVYGLCRDASLRQKFGRLLPFTRNIQQRTSACRLADAMALSLKSGIDPQQSLLMARELMEDPAFLPLLDACAAAMEEGLDLGPALLKAGIYGGVQARMISIGHKTGTLDSVMEDIAGSCQAEIDQSISALLAILEPSMVALLSVIVGGILLSVMLPLLGIMASL